LVDCPVDVLVPEAALDEEVHDDRLGDIAELIEVGRTAMVDTWLDEPIPRPLAYGVAAHPSQSTRSER
jgi:hypothetical protein